MVVSIIINKNGLIRMAVKTLNNWTIENSDTVGTGAVNLTGAINTGQTAFKDGLSAGKVWYSIVDGANREAGYGNFDGIKTITRDNVQSTLINGIYSDNSPAPISLTGVAVVAGTFNTEAYMGLMDDILLNASVLSDHKGAVVDAHIAAAVAVDTTNFSDKLSSVDDTVQAALETIDQFIFGEGELTTIHNDLLNIQGGAAGDYFHLLQVDVTKLTNIEPNAKDDQLSVEVPTDTTNFNNNLSAADTDVQKALNTLDTLTGGGTSIHNDLLAIQGGATDDYFHLLQADVTKLANLDPNAAPDQNAINVPTDTTNFNNNLSAADADVQKALDTLDNMALGGVTPDHNDLNGLDGGATDDYFHLLQTDVIKLAGIETGATADQLAVDVPLDTTNFSSHLTVADVNVQLAMETIDQFVFGEGEITTIHNDLLNIQGGAAGDYFHLLQADVTKLAGIETSAKDDQLAIEVPTDASVFINNLSASDTDVQKALVTIDALDITGGGDPDQDAFEVPTNIAGFTNNLSGSDTDVQKALDTLDDMVLGDITPNHDDLNGLSGGLTDNYWHLTSNEVDKLTLIEPEAKDDQLAVEVPTSTNNFNNNLSAADTDVQKALDTLDNLIIDGGGGGGGGSNANLIMNGGFDIWQRGFPLSDAGYFADRWTKTRGTSDIVTQAALDPADGFASAYGLEYLRVSSGNTIIRNHMEHGIHSTAGRDVTLSYWVKGDGAATSVDAFTLRQQYASNDADVYSLSPVAVTTSWVQHTQTITLAALDAGRLTADSHLQLMMGLSGMNITITFAEFKLELGVEATPYQAPAYTTELAKCQRYYINDAEQRAWEMVGSGVSGDSLITPCYFPTTMRLTQPAITTTTTSTGDLGAASVLSDSANCFHIAADLNATSSGAFAYGSYTADADYY